MAPRLYTLGNAWFSGEQDKKGSIEVGKFADLEVLTDDYFYIEDEKIKEIEPILTIIDRKVVYAKDEFQDLAPLKLNITPSWSPVSIYGGYYDSRNNNNSLKQQQQQIPTTYNNDDHNNDSFIKDKANNENNYILSTVESKKNIKNDVILRNQYNNFICPCCDEIFPF